LGKGLRTKKTRNSGGSKRKNRSTGATLPKRGEKESREKKKGLVGKNGELGEEKLRP